VRAAVIGAAVTPVQQQSTQRSGYGYAKKAAQHHDTCYTNRIIHRALQDSGLRSYLTIGKQFMAPGMRVY
jgi:hypothetical protein